MIVGHYPTRTAVRNTCPGCNTTEVWNCTYKYEDEGHRPCGRCRQKEYNERQANEAEEARLMQLRDDIETLKERGLL